MQSASESEMSSHLSIILDPPPQYRDGDVEQGYTCSMQSMRLRQLSASSSGSESSISWHSALDRPATLPDPHHGATPAPSHTLIEMVDVVECGSTTPDDQPPQLPVCAVMPSRNYLEEAPVFRLHPDEFPDPAWVRLCAWPCYIYDRIWRGQSLRSRLVTVAVWATTTYIAHEVMY